MGCYTCTFSSYTDCKLLCIPRHTIVVDPCILNSFELCRVIMLCRSEVRGVVLSHAHLSVGFWVIVIRFKGREASARFRDGVIRFSLCPVQRSEGQH